ncbi:DNA replication complex GINS protein PSF2-like isoform X2 [Mangifera indica]|uniref:DNA replication complex GINS protein PSF2-like isoform X2 n=1 Tax=Mangifera indica TaxID=29780 RepID=UPI001CFC0A3C|nr:DNA replication complex GINS protein PSF2-like isoform X2 [Mangifera indica]
MEIVHNMRMDSLNFICDYFGPFFSQIFVKVLQWHVVALKKRGKCTIRPPQWMPVSFGGRMRRSRDISGCTIPLYRDIQTSFLASVKEYTSMCLTMQGQLYMFKFEVITSAEFHPTHCNLLAYSSSKGSRWLIDL